MSNKKKTPRSFYIILLLLPFAFFLILEAGLRVFSYGRNLDAFITLSDDYDDLLFINPDIPFRYVTNMDTPPAVTLDAFKKVKTDSTFRIFVMGGSSTAGFPYAYNVTFPKYIQRKLDLLYPDYNIEVINLGITAHNSYTIADLADEVIDQDPDLILIYAGHNEYYGILGVGSTASYGNSMFITKLMISLNRLKTFQLLSDLINRIGKSVINSGNTDADGQTLMARMIGNKDILYGSEVYRNGINQFETNIREFLAEVKSNGINVLIGTVTSNYMQSPFVSVTTEQNLNADSLFQLATTYYEQDSSRKAYNYYHMAKEYDALRFRAPQEINNTIIKLGDEFNYPVVDIDSTFAANSPKDIVGYNLMVDHLHPNIEGYNLIGEEFFKAMSRNKYLPSQSTMISIADADSILISDFPYTKLDSVISALRIRKLLNSYPFTDTSSELKINAVDYIDSVAVRMLSKKISWKLAHQETAEYYFKMGEINNFIAEMNAVIQNQPYSEIPYIFTISRLLNSGNYENALPFLKKLHSFHRSDYSYKWIGSINLQLGKYSEAIDYLERSIELKNTDPQVFYNISGAYYNSGQFDKALNAIKKCLEINPQNKKAQQFYNILISRNN